MTEADRGAGERRDFDKKKRALEVISRSLVGARLEGVRYVELQDLPESWNEHDEIDSVDFGLELDLEGSRIVSIAWDSQFEEYGLNLFEGSLVPEQVVRAAVTDVSHRSRWSDLLGKVIEDAHLSWAAWRSGSLYLRRTRSPNELTLRFSNGRCVWLMAAEKRGDDWFPLGMDHLTVVFDEGVRRELGRSQKRSAR